MASERMGGFANFDRESVMRDLDEKGYAVIPEVCSAQDCDTFVSQYREWMTQFGDERPTNSYSIIMGYNTGNLSTTWNARLKTKPVFAKIWQTEKLLTSVDRIALSPPPESEENGEFNEGTNWLHIDHSANRIGLHAYQGALYLEEGTETDHCFRVMPGSHKFVKEFYEEFEDAVEKSIKQNYIHFQEHEKEWFRKKGCIPTKVPVPKGGMVLWDSRTAHDNCKPERGRPNSDRWRAVVFICMTPARWARPKDIADKKKIYRDVLMTGHWPSQGINPIKDVTPNHSRKINIPDKIPEAAMSEEAKLLAGELEYDFNDGQPNGPNWNPEWQ